MNKLIEVVLTWGRDVVEVRHLDDKCARLTVGTGADDDLFVPLAHARSVELLTRTPHGWLMRPLDASAAPHVIGGDVDVRYCIGPFTVRVHTVEPAKRMILAPVFDALWANVATVTMFATVALVALVCFMPASIDAEEPDVVVNSPRFMTLALKPPPPVVKEPVALASASTNEPTKAPSSGARTARKAPVPSHHASDQEVVNAKLASLFGEHARPLDDGGDGAFAAALDNVVGRGVATAGLGIKGPLSPSDRTASMTGTHSSGRIGTHGRGDGDVRYGSEDGIIGGREDRDVNVVTELPPVIIGTLDKEIIRRVVRDHMSQVRACYERDLQTNPGLVGKVTLRWSIDQEGKVTQATPDGTTMRGVGDCLARAARTWRFPAPRGGGTVVVVYPFVFKST